MDSFELNKIIGAVLGTLLFVMGVGFLAEAIYHPIEGRGPGLTLAEAEVAGEHGAGIRRRIEQDVRIIRDPYRPVYDAADDRRVDRRRRTRLRHRLGPRLGAAVTSACPASLTRVMEHPLTQTGPAR